jgi:glucokinase
VSAVHVGLDIGGTKVLGVAVDADARVLASVRLASEPGPDRVVDVAVAAVRALALQLGRPVATLAGLGVGVPGLVDRRGVLAHAVNLGVGGDGLALADRLAERTGLAVSVENDVNAAALGAATVLGLDGADLAYLSIGTGVAAGLVLGGRVHRGGRGAAGEVGHVTVDPQGPPCSCGQLGCLEALASGSAIARAWPAADGRPAADALFGAAAAGDLRAVRLAGSVADHLAAAVQLLVLTVDVDVVVLGGGVAEVGEPLRAAVVQALGRRTRTSPFLASLGLADRVTLAPADQPVAAVGAALLGPGRRAA